MELLSGKLLARGVARHMRTRGFACLLEFVPMRGLRVDVIALGPKGEIWIVECKSSVADFLSDQKWRGYLDWCDRYFWAVDVNFPTDLLPVDAGLIIADSYDGEIIRMPTATPLAAPRRKKITQKFARDAAWRLQRVIDPRV